MNQRMATGLHTGKIVMVGLSVLSSAVLYVLLLRLFGALPLVRANAERIRQSQVDIVRIELKVDSVRAINEKLLETTASIGRIEAKLDAAQDKTDRATAELLRCLRNGEKSK
jgi:septal ring factor EnvC (AmiA/AmiB activator)